MSDERTLHLPPGYIAEERAYGTVVMNTATGDLVLVATAARNSNEEIGEAAWEHYSDSIRDYIMERRVSVEGFPAAGEPAVGEVDAEESDRENESAARAAKIAADAIDLLLEDVHRHGFGEKEARRRAIEDVSRGCGEGLEPVVRRGWEDA